MGLSRTVSEINGDFGRKSQIFPTPCIYRPCWGSSLWILYSKTRVMPPCTTVKRVWRYVHSFRCNNRVWQTDRQTDDIFTITLSRSACIGMLMRDKYWPLLNSAVLRPGEVGERPTDVSRDSSDKVHRRRRFATNLGARMFQSAVCRKMSRTKSRHTGGIRVQQLGQTPSPTGASSFIPSITLRAS